MSNKQRLINAFGGYQQIVHTDESRPDDLIVETVQDCEPLMEHAKNLRELSRKHPGETFTHVAVMPNAFVDKAMREGWFNDPVALARWINDPDHRAFRTYHGNV